MERNIISWNITNWITVTLMVGVGYVLIGGVVSVARNYSSGNSDLNNATAAAQGTSLAS